MKKVLVIVPSFRITDGISTVIMSYYDDLIENGWHLDFITPNTTEGKWFDKAVASGSNVYVLPQKSKFSRVVKDEIKKIIEKGNYDILHTNISGQITKIAIKTAKRKGCKIIYHCHSPKSTISLKSRISNFIYDNHIISQVDCLVACSSLVGKSKFGSKDYIILKNTINPYKFDFDMNFRTKLRNEYNINDKFVIGVVARMEKEKNPEFILDCFEEVVYRDNGFHLLWVGTGRMEEYILSLVKEKNLEKHCTFVGKQSNVNQWYSMMDMFFLPSLFEGFGIVFVEAQCSGLPCLTSNVVPEDVNVTNLMNKMSLSDSVEHWAEKIISMKHGSRVRCGNVEGVVNAGFSCFDNMTALRRIYESI